MLTPCCADEEKELVALSATTGVNLCWVAEDQAEVAGVSGATVISATPRAVVLGSKGHRKKIIQELQSKERLLVQNSTLPQAIMVAVL